MPCYLATELSINGLFRIKRAIGNACRSSAVPVRPSTMFMAGLQSFLTMWVLVLAGCTVLLCLIMSDRYPLSFCDCMHSGSIASSLSSSLSSKVGVALFCFSSGKTDTDMLLYTVQYGGVGKRHAKKGVPIPWVSNEQYLTTRV